MNQPSTTSELPKASCREGGDDALSLYLDGELPFAQQADLFAHLATCDVCRQMLGATLAFRRMSRQETIAVPASADDAFFRRLDQVKRRSDERVDRTAARRPLWLTRRSVSLRGAAMAACFLFVAGLMYPVEVGDALPDHLVVGLQEQVEFEGPSQREAVYVFYPGLTVEATKIDELAP